MRKRTIISLILVLVILGLSHNAWLTIRPKPQSTVTSIRGGGGGSSTEINRLLTLRTRVSIKFDAMIFIIIAILGFMLSYKLTSYLADFKVEKKYSRLDILFLAACAVLIFLPMSHISDAKKSEAENRNLAVWQPFILKNGRINYNFGRNFDSWFSDRFNFREELFQFYVKTFVLPNKYPCFSNTIWNKKENTFINLARSIREFDSERVSLKLKELQLFLDERNIKLVVFIVPDREFVMDARSVYPLINPQFTSLEKMVAGLSDNINIYYDIDAFRTEQEKNSLVYHNDHHYNEFGSYVVYKFLCEKLGITPVALDEYKLTKSNNTRNVDFLRKNYFNGSLIKKFPVLNQRKDLLDREYSYYDYKYQDDVKLTPIPGSRLSYEFYNPHGRSDEKLYIIHSSFGERVLQFLQANYKHIVNRRYNPVSGRDFSSVPIVEDMEKYKPDTVVIVVNACLFKDILGLKLK